MKPAAKSKKVQPSKKTPTPKKQKDQNAEKTAASRAAAEKKTSKRVLDRSIEDESLEFPRDDIAAYDNDQPSPHDDDAEASAFAASDGDDEAEAEARDLDLEEVAEAAQLADHLRRLLPEDIRSGVLVAGLGNRAVTPDALGSKTAEALLVTAHLTEQFPFFRPVWVLCPGVKGQTGMESLDVVRGVLDRVRPSCLIAVDALAAADAARIGRTVQLSDAGIQPGSGVGNRRAGFSRGSLGLPVLALGVPTVTDLDERGSGRIVTTADVDAVVSDMASVLASALNRALQPGLPEAELEEFLM